ncbi:MFS transporter [Mariniluteicoccus flavus]
MTHTAADETPAADTPVGNPITNRRVLLGSLSGSAIEWYDFLLYGTAATLIFNKQYFPAGDPFVATMLAWIGNLLTFVIRPFGGVFFAHIGDRIGRKKTLVLTLSMMGLGTVAIGLLPTYGQIGMAAPALLYLCRIIQGLAIGGEWGGALLLAYEYAPRERRGFFGSVPQTGVTIGLLLGNAAILLAGLLPNSQFESWGWRLPFIFSIVLVAVGLWIRKGLDETPAFRKLQSSEKVEKLPLATTLTHHWRAVLVAVLTKAAETAPFYIFATFIVSYGTRQLGFTRPQVLNAVLLGALVSTIFIPISGWLSDRFGRRQVYIVGIVALGLASVAYFPLVATRNTTLLYAASVLALGVAWAPVTATLGTMMSETFSANVRYTGITLGYQIGAALFSGTAPMIAEWLVKEWNGAWWPVATYLAVICAVSLVAALFSRRIAVDEDDDAPHHTPTPENGARA